MEQKSVTYISPKKFLTPKAEPELSFRIGKDIEPGTHTRASILPMIQSVIPSIEIIDSRFSKVVGVYQAIADNANSGALVLSSKEQPVPSAEKLADMEVRLIVDREVMGEGLGSNVLGNPIDSLVWLANALARYNITLRR